MIPLCLIASRQQYLIVAIGEGDQEDVEEGEDIEDYDEEEKEYEFGEGEYRMEEDELWEGEESEQESSNALPEYNSREISDFITDI